MNFKKLIRKIHRLLGLVSGIIIVFLGLTGCLLTFQREIESLQSYRYVKEKQSPLLPPSVLKRNALAALPGKQPHSVEYGKAMESAKVLFYHTDPAYFYIVYIDPYSGLVKKVQNMDSDFFRIILNGHYYLWLPPRIGQPLVASFTLIFLVMLISGILLWWPGNKAARKQRFSIKRNASWKRTNYDLHSVLGFYASWIGIFLTVTGLVWGFQWFARSVYWATSAGKKQVEYYEPPSSPNNNSLSERPAVDQVWLKMKAIYRDKENMEIHYPETDTSALIVAINPDPSTYYKTDYRYFDRYSLKELSVTHPYGRYAQASLADKISRMNYDIHTGQILGLPGKMLAFFGSLVISSLPVTGFLIWYGRRKKTHGNKTGKNATNNGFFVVQP